MNKVRFHPELKQELGEESDDVTKHLLKIAISLKELGKGLPFPHTSHLHVPKGTQPLKKLRFKADGGVWRVPYCLVGLGTNTWFLLLAIGDKRGMEPNSRKSRMFHEELVHRAQQRLEAPPVDVVWP